MNFLFERSNTNSTVNPQMIIIARETRGFTQSDLAKQSGISQSNISKFEGGQLTVSPENLRRIAKATHFPESFFLLPERRYDPLSEEDSRGGIYHRRQVSMNKGDLRVVHAKLNILRIQLARLLNHAQIEHDYEFPCLHPSDFAGGPEEIARQVRKAWDMPSGPVDNMVDAIEAGGGIIVMNEFNTMKLDGITQYIPETQLPPLIFLNADMPGDRQRWTLAHELGHIVMHCRFSESHLNADVEEEADRFANEFLMPAYDIGPVLFNLNLPALVRLKAYWKVSMGALIYRAHQLGKISDRQKRTLYRQMNANRYGRNEPLPILVEEPTILQQLLQVHRGVHGYSLSELSRMLAMHEDELQYVFGLEPGPNDWLPSQEPDRQRTGLWVEPFPEVQSLAGH